MSSNVSSFQPLMQVTSLISSSVAIPFSMRKSIFCSRVMASLLLLEKVGEGFGFNEFIPESAHGTGVAPVVFFVCLECHQPGFDSLDDFEGFSLAALGDLDYFGIFHVALPCGVLSSQTVFFLQNCMVTAFQLFLGCKNHHGSVTPNRMATETLRKPKMAKKV